MTKGEIHTVPHGDQWANKVEGNDSVANTASTKSEAQEEGRRMAKGAGVEHHIHNSDGTIAERSSYGNDPASRPG